MCMTNVNSQCGENKITEDHGRVRERVKIERASEFSLTLFFFLKIAFSLFLIHISHGYKNCLHQHYSWSFEALEKNAHINRS